MKLKIVVSVFVFLFTLQLFLQMGSGAWPQSESTGAPSVYVGVDVAYEDLASTKQTVDRISSYANLLIIGCTGVTYNQTRLDEVAQYVVDRNMSFIVYTDRPRGVPATWIEAAKIRFGSRFLGLYIADELGGRQLDQDGNFTTVTDAVDYADAKLQFVSHVNYYLNFFRNQTSRVPFFTSDYALYNFDYQAGYDVVFAEFGWNYSRPMNIALCRGAAVSQGKDWGAMLTWTFTHPPYLESGPELYNDMVLAYQNGAKYIVVFDTNKNYTQSILKQEHFDAMQKFWRYTQNNPRSAGSVGGRTAYVLPADYAFGFRGQDDKIWGLWSADSTSTAIGMSVASMLQMFGTNLDVIYPDSPQPIGSLGYALIVYWNDERLIPPEWPNLPTFPNPTTSPTSPTQTPLPTSAPTPSPAPSSVPSISPSPTATSSPQITTSPPPDAAGASLLSGSSLYWAISLLAAGLIGWSIGLKYGKRKSSAH